MKCLRSFVCAGLLLFTLCSCSSMLAAKTVVTVYDPNGSGNKIADIFNNKSYQGLSWNVEKMPDGTVRISYKAEITDANTIAEAAITAQGQALGVIQELVNVGKGIVVGQ